MLLDLNMAESYSWQDVAVIAQQHILGPGGTWHPTLCQARLKMLIIIPFRERWSQLRAFLAHMHPVLQLQQLDYRILVVEQVHRDLDQTYLNTIAALIVWICKLWLQFVFLLQLFDFVLPFQQEPLLFNKAALMNAGFKEAMLRRWKFDCVMFHDVDLVLEDDRNLIKCGKRFFHYGAYIDRCNYEL